MGDAPGPLDAATTDTLTDVDGGARDATAGDDARTDGATDPPSCAAVLAAATEIALGTTATGATCTMVDLVDFDCVGTIGAPEAYYVVNATEPATILLSSGAGADGFVFSRIDPTDCSVISCGLSLLPVGPDGRVYVAVEHLADGCGATYTLSAVRGWP